MSFLYYYPNRPTLIPPDPDNPLNPKPDLLNSLEKSGKYLAELKENGDNLLIYTEGMKFWNRHKELHRYTPTPEVTEELNRLPAKSIINAELVHFKTKTIKHRILVHCIMAYKGNLLTGKTWNDSRHILEDLDCYGSHLVLSPVWTSGFWDLFQTADVSTVEGLVLKDPSGKLQFSTTPLKDVNWMLKVRKPCKKYQF